MARVYSKVERYVWRDVEFRELPRLSKLIWLYLLTSPSLTSIPGLIPASLAMVADDMSETLSEPFRNGFQALVKLGWVRYDERARLIYLPFAVKHNLPENPNVVTGWSTAISEIPDSPFKIMWVRETKELLERTLDKDGARLEAFRKGFGNRFETVTPTVPEPFRNQEQEQEQKQYQEQDQKTPLTPRGGDDDFDTFWKKYPRKIGRKAARRSWDKAKDRPSIDVILAAIEAQKRSPQWTKDDGAFIPHPSTWLNQGRWDDEEAEDNSTDLSWIRPKRDTDGITTDGGEDCGPVLGDVAEPVEDSWPD
jgi:hypothetical protein